ncbi:MAG: glucan biosynthesis glucosyltransferase [Rhodospirillales bacterium]|nr:glucan biosynthesis glucosyltransferase [Rhodospirillales bacterium]
MGLSVDALTDADPAGDDAALPPETPLAMPVQSLRAAPSWKGRPPTSPRFMALRRFYVIGGTLVLTAAAGNEMYRALSVGGLTPLELVVLLLFVALFAWIAFAFVSALAGFVSLLGGGGLGLGITRDGPLPILASRTALLMPTYNESPARVMAGLQAITESVAATGALEHFDIFILSDTTDPEIWLAEEAAFLALRQRTGGHRRIFYRRRAKNFERKAGNISDWVRRFGGGYAQMLILDADSVMTGDAIVRLAGAMEAHPTVGLIQTLPIIVNGTTVFARMQQFAGRVYGPLIAHGIAWWHGSEGNYWGHNAIIRTRAFAEQAGLPHLRGRKPFGGHVMSHDFVEAALLRRGGWAVHMVPGLKGSYEEGPPSLSDVLVRDRRWCQGNLQHAAVLAARRLHWNSRLHLLTGIGSYVTAPMWLMFLVIGVLISLQARFIPPDYFPSGPSLFPQWPIQDPVRSMWVFIGTMGILLAPKLLSWIALLADRTTRRGCGGMLRSLLGLLLETVVGGLIAPVTMLSQSLAVVAILIGRDSGWRPQRRDDGGIPFREILRGYWPTTVFGLLLGIASYLVAPSLLLWMSPVVLGLSLAIPLAALTSRADLGRAIRSAGMLRTPEESEPPEVLLRARRLADELRRSEEATTGGLQRFLRDDRLVAAHRRMLPPPRRRGDPIDAVLLVGLTKLGESETLAAAIAALTTAELAAALNDPRGVDALATLAQAAAAG